MEVSRTNAFIPWKQTSYVKFRACIVHGTDIGVTLDLLRPHEGKSLFGKQNIQFVAISDPIK